MKISFNHLQELFFEKLHIDEVSKKLYSLGHENEVEGNPWELDLKVAQMNGVLTQSVTLASEAVILGVPTLLVTKAKRGFLDRLQEDGYPLFIAREHDESILAAWLSGIHLLDALEVPNWPNTKSEMLDLLKH